MEKERRNKWILHPFHVVMAWLLVELFVPIVWFSDRRWYQYLLVLLWVLLLWVMDVVLKKMVKLWWRVCLLELVFLLMVWCAWLIVMR